MILIRSETESKIFKDSHDNCNARAIMAQVEPSLTEEVINMINLVSCSHNGGSWVEHDYMAIPRDCDRLEAIGHIGIIRCREYAEYIGNPRHLPSTPQARTIDEVEALASPQRFEAYAAGAKSLSEIDHYYDKLLHIGRPEHLKSNNPYILDETSTPSRNYGSVRPRLLTEFVLSR